MYKFFFILILFLSILLSDENKTKVEILSGSIKSDQKEIFADNGSIILSDKISIQSKQIYFDRNSSTVYASGDVLISKDGNVYLACSKSEVNIKNNNIFMKPFFLYDENSDVWIKSKKSNFKDKIYKFDKSIVSSCNVEAPEWSIRFTSGDFNSKLQWLNLYNARLYVNSIPIFYLPYFGFPTNRKRRSGLLPPKIYFSNDEGFYYSQPIFIAPFDNWDIELEPHIRTKRGYGGYTTFRFVDTRTSKGSIKFGGFKEDGNYAKKFNLKNYSHYGYQILYKNYNLLDLKKDYNNGLYLSYENFNDIDYKNLQSKENLNIKTKIATSKLNYYIKNNEYYAGLYARYFINTESTQDENKKTLQNLPTIQLHRFADNLFYDNISYSINLNYENFYRQIGFNAYKNELHIPIEFSVPVLNDYLILSAKENIVLSQIKYTDKEPTNNYEDGYVVRENYQFGVIADLSRKYDSLFHNIKLEATYIKPAKSVQNGDIYGLTNKDENLSFTTFPVDNEYAEFSFNQYFYHLNGDLILSHFITQRVNYEDGIDMYSDLENEIIYNISSRFSVSNRLFFNHKNQKITSLISSISYGSDNFNGKLTHIYKNLLKSEYNAKADYYTLGFDKKITSYLTTFGKVEYDKIEDFYKKLELGFIVDKRCISYKVSYSKTINHSLTKDENNIINNRIFFELNLKPVGKQNYAYEIIQKGNQ